MDQFPTLPHFPVVDLTFSRVDRVTILIIFTLPHILGASAEKLTFKEVAGWSARHLNQSQWLRKVYRVVIIDPSGVPTVPCWRDTTEVLEGILAAH